MFVKAALKICLPILLLFSISGIAFTQKLPNAIKTHFFLNGKLKNDKVNYVRLAIENSSPHDCVLRIADINTHLVLVSSLKEQTFNVAANSTKYIPIKLLLPKSYRAEQAFTLNMRLEFTLNGTQHFTSLQQQFWAEIQDRIICSIPTDNILLRGNETDAHVDVSLFNTGNTSSPVIITLKNSNQNENMQQSRSMVLPSGKDTLIQLVLPASFGHNTNSSSIYYLRVSNSENSKTYFYRTITVQSLSSEKRYVPIYASNTNTIGFRYQKWGNQEYYNLLGNGNLPVSENGYNLLYRYYFRKYPFYQTVFADQVFLNYNNGRNSFQLGDIYYGEDVGLYNRGASAEVALNDHFKVNASYTDSRFLQDRFSRFQAQEIISGGLSYRHSDNITKLQYLHAENAFTKIASQLLYATHKRKIGTNGELEAGLGISTETLSKNRENGIGGRLSFNYRAENWNFISNNRYYSPHYVFLNKGNSQFQQVLRYTATYPVIFDIAFKYNDYSPNFALTTARGSTNYTNTRASLGVTFMEPNASIKIVGGLGGNDLYSPFLTAPNAYRNTERFISAQLSFRPGDFYLHFKQQISRISPKNTKSASYFAGISEVQAAYNNTSLSLYYNKGAFNIYDQANFVFNNTSRNYLMLRGRQQVKLAHNLKLSLEADYYHDNVFDYNSYSFYAEPEWKIHDFRISYRLGHRTINSFSSFNHVLSVFKDFNNPFKGKHSLHIHTFNDLNYNGVQDESEPSVQGVLLDVNSLKLITDEKGNAICKSLPEKDYTIRLLDSKGFNGKTNKINILLNNKKKLSIPLYSGVQIMGKVSLPQGEKYNAFGLIRIEVKDMATDEIVYLPCDYRGNFEMHLKKGKIYQMSIDQSFLPKNYSTEKDSYIIHTNEPQTEKIHFILKKEEREVKKRFFSDL